MAQAPDTDRSTTLYRYFDAKGELLYIGIAYDVDERKKGHARTASDSWYPLIAKRDVQFFPTRAEAEDAEARAIRAEKPRYNRRHVTKRDPAIVAEDEAKEQRRWITLGTDGVTGRQRLHVALSRTLRERIDSGFYEPGESLPTKPELLKTFAVNASMLKFVCQEMENDGYIRKAGIRGYVVLPAEARRVSVCVGLPEEAAATLRAAMTADQLATLIAALSA
jgi:DNA-binding transcriptional regulator YhcF (GntR family)